MRHQPDSAAIIAAIRALPPRQYRRLGAGQAHLHRQPARGEYRREIEALPPEKWFPNSKANRAAAARLKPRPGLRDRRVPLPGSVLTRTWKGNEVVVKVRESGFEYDGRLFRLLSAVASEVTGTSWNGFTFFGVDRKASR